MQASDSDLTAIYAVCRSNNEGNFQPNAETTSSRITPTTRTSRPTSSFRSRTTSWRGRSWRTTRSTCELSIHYAKFMMVQQDYTPEIFKVCAYCICTSIFCEGSCWTHLAHLHFNVDYKMKLHFTPLSEDNRLQRPISISSRLREDANSTGPNSTPRR